MNDAKNILKYPFLSLKQVNEPFAKRLKEFASQVIDSDIVLHGPFTRQLEERLCPHAKYCVGVSNGLDALRLILRAYIEMGLLKPADEVIVSAGTYIASVLAISDSELKPVLCDISPVTLNMDTRFIEAKITDRTRAIMVVHLYGNTCWDTTIKELAQKYNLLIIEDNAQAIGASSQFTGINGTSNSTGALGHAAAWSFYPTKNIGALGDAGAVTTDSKELADTVRAIANYGSTKRYHNEYIGLNCRIDEIQAASICVKLDYLAEETERRRAVAKAYSKAISNPQVITPQHFQHDEEQVWHQYVIRCERRDELRQYLLENGVGTDVHYPTPPHLQPCYAKQFRNQSFPEAEALAKQAISLPIAYPITPQQATEISEIINRFS